MEWKKFQKDLDSPWHRKLTLKSKISTFSIAEFRTYVDLQKTFRWKSSIYHSIKLPFDVEVGENFFIGI
jgi:hypothetical protein